MDDHDHEQRPQAACRAAACRSALDHDRQRVWRPPMHGERERGACCVRGDGAGESERESDLAIDERAMP